ncbi:MAG: NUDIX domain-containing protein, partial [Brachymonas sp.]|nr:NUDIX domain-containing protein [Brachymonas sp.]
LLERAEALLPAAKPAATRHDRMVAYTQGLMDLGATVCLPRQPACERCPVAGLCQARAQGRPLAYPVKTGKLKRTAETWWLLALVHAPEKGDESGSKLWLQKRPQPGIWGGLHCLPVLHSEAAWRQLVQQLHDAAVGVQSCTEHAPIKHVLTHKDLMLHPVVVRVADAAACTQTLASSLPGGWQAHWADVGLPAPVRKWLDAHLASFV